ncbi:uncharacterized protein [Anoplolepis gracilipes]|uniref:uncharacterized protein n=1 Tax=Anoplolepis gracilipes TaxID=354296 RepID=UPI003BA1CDBF
MTGRRVIELGVGFTSRKAQLRGTTDCQGVTSICRFGTLEEKATSAMNGKDRLGDITRVDIARWSAYETKRQKEDRPPSSNSSRKSATLNTGNKIYKSRIPTTQVGRNAMQGDSPMCEESSGINSNNNSARRPSMTLNMLSSNRKPTNTITVEKRQMEIQYSSKKIRYTNLKKTLAEKQKITQDLYDEISNLREKIISAGGKDPGKVEEPKSSQVECPKQSLPIPIETNLPDYGQWEQICIDESMVIGVSLLQNQLQDLCHRSQELCQRALDRSLSFASVVKSWLTESPREQGEIGKDESILVDYSQAEMQQTILARSNEELKTQLDELRTAQKDFITEFAATASSLRVEYDNYIGRVKKEQPNVNLKDLQEQLSVALQELKAERDRTSQGKERMRMIELQMQKVRTKNRELEAHVTNEESKSQQLQSSVKSLEAQLKQKDQTIELRMKDMNKTMKSSEDFIAKMEKQRDTFESRMLELKQRMVHKEAEANAIIKELSEKCRAIDEEMNEERKKRLQAENALTEIEERCKHLEEKSQLLCDLASEKSNNIAVTDNNHTENEICLYNDLTAARAELEQQREKIEQLEREKQEIITVLHQAASDSEDETKDKLAAELIAKTNDLQNLMLEHAQLQKIARFTQERNEVLENQLAEIQRHLYAKSKEDGKTGFDTIELQQQISDLRNSLAEAMQQNQELETTLTQKQLELEQRDRVMREQSKFLKARDELLSLLKGKQANADNLANENYEDIDQINKQIAAKTEAIQELYTTLEGKQMQVMRLEKLVKLLEDQQDRAQAQRTRLEHRIAQLEVSLREKNNSNRYVIRKYSDGKPRPDIIDDKLPRAFSCESKRALLKASMPSFRLIDSCSCKRSESSHHRCHYTSPIKNRFLPPHEFYLDDWQVFSDKEEAFVCEQCQRETNDKFKHDVIHHVKDDQVPIRESLYSWLMDSSVLEAFGEPTIGLNRFHRHNSFEKNTDCFLQNR